MALTFGHDDHGPYGVLDCDHPGCAEHISARPLGPGDRLPDALDLADYIECQADAAGWWLLGSTSCPRHTIETWAAMGLHVAYDGPRDPETPREAVKPEAVATAAQRGLTAVH